LSLYLINRFLKTCICHEYDRSNYTLELIPVLGVGFYSFLDGVIYSVTFNVSIFTGILAAMGLILHEFPDWIVTFLLLGRAGFDRKKSTLGALLALSAGALVYVGAPHFRPAVEKENKRYCLGLLSNRGIGCYNDRYA
jgi:zinc transporter ZupT